MTDLARIVQDPTDLTATTRDARKRIKALVPQLHRDFSACWDLLYHDHNREREPSLTEDEPTERIIRCGSCEHPDDHKPLCTQDGCRCQRWEAMPSTVGWGLWTTPGKAEVAYVSATKELQRAHNCLRRIYDVPAHWTSSALHHPGERTVPMRIELVTQGLDLLAAALEYVDDLAPPEASALLECQDHVEACVKALARAEDRLAEFERRELDVPRCAVPGCRVKRHANSMCQSHYDAQRRAS